MDALGKDSIETQAKLDRAQEALAELQPKHDALVDRFDRLYTEKMTAANSHKEVVSRLEREIELLNSNSASARGSSHIAASAAIKRSTAVICPALVLCGHICVSPLLFLSPGTSL